MKLLRIATQSRLRALSIGLALALSGPVLLPAQNGLRTPTAEERQILNHYRDVLYAVLDSMENDNWQQDAGAQFDIDDGVLIGHNPAVPLDIDESIAREYRVRPGSPLFQQQIAPFLAQVQAAGQDAQKLSDLAGKLKPSHVHINVHFNVPNVSIEPSASQNPNLKLNGVAMGYATQGEPAKEKSVTLLFGDWKPTDWNSSHRWYHFRFQHPGSYPAIENIVIELQGSPERIDELLHSTDWQRVNGALALQKH